MAATRDTQDVLILEQQQSGGALRGTQDALILECVIAGATGALLDTQDCVIIEIPQSSPIRDTQDCIMIEIPQPVPYAPWFALFSPVMWRLTIPTPYEG